MGQVILGARTLARTRQTSWTVTLAADTAAIGARWHAVETAGAATAFQSREWLDAWYQAAGATGAEPLVALIDDDAGECALILPLVISQQDGRRAIRFADLGVSDYNAPILGPAAPQDPAAMLALWAALKRALPPADLVLFDKMPRLIGARPNPLLWLGAGLSAQTQSACRLAEPWHLARQRLMPKSFRDSLDGRRRKLARKADLAFRLASTPAEVDAYFAALVAQKAARSGPMGWQNILEEGHWREFYHRLAMRGIDGGMTRLMALVVDREPVSVILGLERSGRFYDLLTSFDATKWKRHSLGLLALDDGMGFMAARGVELYDLTIGAEGYKDNFGPDSEPLYEHAEALSWRGVTVAMKMRAKSALRRNPRLAQFARNVAYSSRVSPVAVTHLATHGPVGVVGTAAGL